MPDAGLTDNVSFYTSTFHDTYVRQQVVTTCTSATRPSGVEGRHIYETDTDRVMVYDGTSWVQVNSVGAWTSWTPAVTQSGSVTVTNTRSVYARYGRLIHVTFSLSVTGAGTGANNISITLPVNAAAADAGFGSGYLVDSSASLSYGFNVKINTTNFNLATQVEPAGPTPFLGTNSFTAGLASGDTIRGGFTYEAAS